MIAPPTPAARLPAPPTRRWVGLITPRVVLTMVVVVGLSLVVAQFGILTLRSIRDDTSWVHRARACRVRTAEVLRLAALIRDADSPSAAAARRQLREAAHTLGGDLRALNAADADGAPPPPHDPQVRELVVALVARFDDGFAPAVHAVADAETSEARRATVAALERHADQLGQAIAASLATAAARVEQRVTTFASLQVLLVVVAVIGLLGALWSARELYRRERDAEQAAAHAAALQAQAHLASLGRMAAVVAHEVRNPLAALQTSLGMVQGQLPADAAHARTTVADLRERIGELDTLVTDILRFARPADPRRQRQSLRGVLQGAWHSVAGDHSLAAVEMDICGDDLPVEVDGPMLGRAISNLFLNAGQAMQGTGRVAVRLAQTDGRPRVTVADTGPGLAPQARARLFEPFVTTKTRGTGLGLAVARRVVEAHGGTLTVDDGAEGGTVATIDLPAAH